MGIETAQALNDRLGWTMRLRPMAVGAFIAGMLAPERRTIVKADTGLSYFVDPLSQFGQSILQLRRYEIETEQIIREHLFERENFLDVGANEGYFSVLAASIVGPEGYVAAIEPQSRLNEIIRVNVALNGGGVEIFHGALGGAKGDSCQLYLSPPLNTGSSNLLKPVRFSHRTETVNFVDPVEILGRRDSFAFVKIDVEGFEDNVINSLLPLLEQGRIRTLLLDYHASVLHSMGIDPATIERKILNSGMSTRGSGYSGYRIYMKN